MPELPEVETTRQGILPLLKNQQVIKIIVRQWQLRWPIPKAIKQLENQLITSIERRGKYLLFRSAVGTAILHLGMSGRVCVLPIDSPLKKHDHVDIIFLNKLCLRYNDTRRFGALLWTTQNPLEHPLLVNLGPEPLTAKFNPVYLLQKAARSNQAIKLLIMNSKIVVGVGNIYANEALFQAGIHPQRPAKTLNPSEAKTLVTSIKAVLHKAIKAGGTTLKDFQQSDGKPGYFQQQLQVYGRQGLDCLKCFNPLECNRLGQRMTVYCEFCQV